jgi:hypothetical protein
MWSAILTAIFWCVFMESLSTFRTGVNGPATRTSSTAITLASTPGARPSIINKLSGQSHEARGFYHCARHDMFNVWPALPS